MKETHVESRIESFADQLVKIYDERWATEIYRKANFWDVIEYGAHSYETRYSRMLRWLLDPEETHELGSWFLEQFWIRATDMTVDLRQMNPAETLRRLDFGEAPEIDEAKVEKHRTDVLVVEKESVRGRDPICLAVENKTGSKVHVKGETDELQTSAYYTTLKNAHENHRLCLVYLAPKETLLQDEEELAKTSDGKFWQLLSYQGPKGLEGLLEETIDRVEDPDVKKIIQDFQADQIRQFRKNDQVEMTKLFFGESASEARARDWLQYIDNSDSYCVEIATILSQNNYFDTLPEDPFWQIIVEKGKSRYDPEGPGKDLTTQVQQCIENKRPQINKNVIVKINSFLWAGKPRLRTNDHTKNPQLKTAMEQFYLHIVGPSVDPKTTPESDVLDEFKNFTNHKGAVTGLFKTAEVGSQSITFTRSDGVRIRVQGKGGKKEPKFVNKVMWSEGDGWPAFVKISYTEAIAADAWMSNDVRTREEFFNHILEGIKDGLASKDIADLPRPKK